MALGMSVDEAYEVSRSHDTVKEFKGYCGECEKEVVFSDHSGRKGCESFSYCRCTECGGIDTWE